MRCSKIRDSRKDDLRAAVSFIDTILLGSAGPRRLIDARIVADAVPTRSPIGKEDLDLTTTEGFAEWVLRLALDLRISDRYAVERSVNRLLPFIQANWSELTRDEIDEILDSVSDYVVWLREQIVRLQTPILETTAETLILNSMNDHAAQYGLSPRATFSRIDDAEVRFLRDSTVNFMRARDRTISDEFSRKAREVVSDGLARGYSGKTIANNLQVAFNSTQPTSYYLLLANQFVSRARSWGLLRSFKEAGLEYAEIVAVLDERTTEICRWLDGKVISVNDALDSMTRGEESTSPEQVKELNPWVREGNDDIGGFFYIDRPGGRLLLGRVERPGMGTLAPGTYKDLLDMNEMQTLGIGPPPYHANCRSTLLPVMMGDVS